MFYWVCKKRIIELFMQSQSQVVHNSVAVLKKFNDDFIYDRIDLKFDDNFNVAMDETNKHKLDVLAEKALREYQFNGQNVLDTYFNNRGLFVKQKK